MIKTLQPTAYYPSANRGGADNGMIFRMSNMLVRGEGAQSYLEVFSGSKDISEPIPTADLTGTLTIVAGSPNVVGVGTAFLSELHLGQYIIVHKVGAANSVECVVMSVIDNTHFTACRPVETSIAAGTGTREPVLFAIDQARGSALRGHAVEFDNGNIFGVGDGELLVNGQSLPGTPLNLSRTPQLAQFNSGSYTPFTLEIATPPAGSITAADGGPGTKGMVTGTYSLRVCAARQATGGMTNPTEKISVTLASVGDLITVTIDATAIDTAHGQDAFAIFVPLQAFLAQTGIQGPWFQLPTPHPFNLVWLSDLSGTGPFTYSFEYNDGEIGGTITALLAFDNDPPPECEFVEILSATPIWISAEGSDGSSPGPVIVAANPGNIEAAPEELAYLTAGPETIIGEISAQGRIYLMCSNTLQILQSTQTTDPNIPPFQIRPYWHSGFLNPYALTFVDGYLIGFTNHGLARSLSDGDEGSEEFAFALPMDEFFRDLNPGHVLLALEPTNNAVCVFHSGDSINASGFWTSRVWVYSLRSNQWIGDITLSSTTGDMFVSGVANVSGLLYFLAGGLQNDGTVKSNTYLFDERSDGVAVPYYMATCYSDDNVQDRPKRVSKLRIVAQQINGGTAAIYGVRPGTLVDVIDLETGASGGVSGPITLPGEGGQEGYDALVKLNCKNLAEYAVRISGSWIGGALTARDRIDRIAIESFVDGCRR